MLGGDRKGEMIACQIYVAPDTPGLLTLERIRDYTADMNARYAALLDGPDPVIVARIQGE